MNIEEVDINASLKTVAPLLHHVHLADSNRQAPGHGHLALQPIVQTLVDVGYQGFVCFEFLPLPDEHQALLDAVTTLDSLWSAVSH